MSEKQKKIILISSVVLWMAIIFLFSAQNAADSSALSGSFTKTILHGIKTLFPDIRQVQLNHIQMWMTFFIRKVAHASVYFVLGILAYVALGKEMGRKKRFCIAIGICFLYACSDEFHQLFVSGRSCELSDVCIDTVGALLGIGVVVFINWIRRIKAGKPWNEARKDVRMFRIGLGILGIILIILLMILYLYLGKNLLITTKYTVESSKIPEVFNGYKILQISDLHSKKFSDNNEKLAKTMNDLGPDIIVATGDMLNAAQDDDGDVFFDLVKKLDPKIPIYYIAGNHETVDERSNSKAAEIYFNKVDALGVIRLKNEKVSLEKGGKYIDLYGLEPNITYYRDRRNPDFDKIKLTANHVNELVGETDATRFTTLLAHNPLYFEAYADWGADLTLSGHVHGGMINVPFKGGMFSPEYSLWPEYYGGDYHKKERTMYVNRGIGGSGDIPFRILNNPEISLITLKKQ